MESQLKQKKIIYINLTRIDIENILNGIVLKSAVKTNFETEVPYEVEIMKETT